MTPAAATDSDISGTITATQNSLSGSAVAGQIAADGDLGGNQFGVKPVLGPLADNGGPTQTLALLLGVTRRCADETKAAGEGVPPGNPLTDPTVPGRSVCAPGSLSSHSTAGQPSLG